MPYEWDDETKGASVKSGALSFADGDDPAARLTLWPHRSLPPRGFAAFIGITFAMFMLPLLALLGTLALWGLLPFLLGALALTWYFLQRSYRDAELREDLLIWSDRVELTRTNPRRSAQSWTANPHWVRVEMHKTGGPVENYLTLAGGGRTVEIGAFLAPDERDALYTELLKALSRA